MPTPKKGPRLASSPAHERLMLANMATSLFQYGRITTTLQRTAASPPPCSAPSVCVRWPSA